MIRPQTAHTERRSNITKRAANLTFRQNAPLEAIKYILGNYKDNIKETQWRFNFEEYKKKNIRKIFDITEISLIKSLTLHFCKSTSIVKQIEGISFPRLVSLELNGNNIVSLEGFQKCHMPSLQNNITSVKPLRRLSFKLKILDVSSNKITDFHYIWGYLDLSNLQKLYLSDNPVVFEWGIIKSNIIYKNMVYLYVSSGININKGICYNRLSSFTPHYYHIGI